MLKAILEALGTLTGWIWNPAMIWFCLIVGIIYTVVLKGFQVRYIGDMVKLLFGSNAKKSMKGTSSFEAFALSIANRVGVGNVVGVVTAIAYGGPGAIFWMWIIAIFGAATTFAENSMAQVFKERLGGVYRGGGAYYIEKGLGARWLAVIFAFLGFFQTGIFSGLQPQTMAEAMHNAFGIPRAVFGIFLVISIAVIIFGGLKRIANFASKVVPVMAVSYIIFAITLILLNITEVPSVFALIVSSAFGKNAVFGGMLGSAITMGIKRGIYSSEAGMGTSSQHGATADVSHPAKQGLVQAFSVYIDTLGVCTATAFMLLITGLYNVYDRAGNVIYEGMSGVEAGVAYTQGAVDTLIPGFGVAFIAIFVFFFAFTTVVAIFNIAETNLMHMYKGYANNKVAQKIFRIWFLVPLFVGTIMNAQTAWNIADIGMGLQVWVTLITLMLFVPTVKKVWDDYVAQKAEGKDPIFRPSKCGIKNAELWEEIADEYEAQEKAV